MKELLIHAVEHSDSLCEAVRAQESGPEASPSHGLQQVQVFLRNLDFGPSEQIIAILNRMCLEADSSGLPSWHT